MPFRTVSNAASGATRPARIHPELQAFPNIFGLFHCFPK